MFAKIMAVILAVVLVAYAVFYIRRAPQLFTGKAIQQSFFTLAVLALFLIGFLGFCIMLLRS